MEIIKKFAKEISVFGLVLVIFIGLMVYRSATYSTYKTISTKSFESMVERDQSFIVVVGSSLDTDTENYLDVVTTYQTKHRHPKIYYVDIANQSSNYTKQILGVDVVTPTTLIIKKGEVTAKKAGAIQYYTLYDFIKENN
ncbi:MAG: hypothetical protein J6P61_10300 [Erysipelotrichaceae bacterium]|nr:hypothetical protein [Erysipelotrichaceae bacterium]